MKNAAAYDRYMQFMLLIFLPTISILNGYALLRTGTDYDLIGLFKAGEFFTYCMNPLTGYVLSKLYIYFPSFPWYSLLLIIIFYIDIFLVFVFISNNTAGLIRISLIIAFSYLYLQITYIFSITIITGLTIATSCLFINKKINLFLITIILSSILRVDIFILYYFIILVSLAAIILSRKLSADYFHLVKKIFIILFIPITLNSINNFILKSEHYKSFYTRNLLTTSIDYDIYQYGVITEEQYFLTKNGLAWDFNFYKDINISNFPSVISIYINNFSDNIKNIKFKHQNYIYVIYLVSIFFIFLFQKKPEKTAFIRSGIVFIILLLYLIFIIQSRDVLRTTVPLMIATLFATIISFTSGKITVIQNRLIYLLMISILIALSLISYKQHLKQIKTVKIQTELIENANYLINKYNDKNIILGVLPLRGYYPSFPLLRESDNLARDFKNNIFRQGWMAGHPYFLTKIKNALNNELNVHSFILDPDTIYIGRPLKHKDDEEKLMKIYDKYYPIAGKKHATSIIEIRNGFIAAKIILE